MLWTKQIEREFSLAAAQDCMAKLFFMGVRPSGLF